MEQPSSPEEVDHTADYAFRVRADGFAALLEKSAQALYTASQLTCDAEPSGSKTLDLKAEDPEGLLVTFLNELIWLMESGQSMLDGWKWNSLTNTGLQTTASIFSIQEQQKAVKAATFHGLSIQTTESGLEAVVVFDV